jgi:hypothetical protein
MQNEAMRLLTVLLLATLARPSIADTTSPAARADWTERCRARFEALRAKVEAFGKVTLSVKREPSGPPGYGDVRMEADDEQMGQVAADVGYDPTPDTHGGEPRKVPHIWDRWHAHSEDAEVPYSAYVPHVWSLMDDERHHRLRQGALWAWIGARTFAAEDAARARAARFAALVRPALEACLADDSGKR